MAGAEVRTSHRSMKWLHKMCGRRHKSPRTPWQEQGRLFLHSEARGASAGIRARPLQILHGNANFCLPYHEHHLVGKPVSADLPSLVGAKCRRSIHKYQLYDINCQTRSTTPRYTHVIYMQSVIHGHAGPGRNAVPLARHREAPA